jgi:hypothetical protein
MTTDTDQLIQILLSEENEAKEVISNANSEQIEFLFYVLATIRLSLEKHVHAMRTDKSIGAAVAGFLFCKVIRTCRATRFLSSAGWGNRSRAPFASRFGGDD